MRIPPLCVLAGFALLSVAARAEMPLDPQSGVGAWIWAAKTFDRQECRFVRAFTIPSDAAVRSARLRITADNSYHVFLDGQPIGQGGDWRVLIEYDLRELLVPGEHVLAVDAVNDFDVAGLRLGLRIVLSDGREIEIASDETWKAVPEGEKTWVRKTRAWNSWPAATVLDSEKFMADANPKIYRAPVSRPLELALWQRGWFQLGLSVVALGSVVFGLFFASRLLLKSQMERVVRRERARIAEDLHDELGGGLTQLVLIGETSRRKLSGDSETAADLQRLCMQARGLLRGMNETVWLINSRRDTIRDFASYVGKYAESFFQNSEVRCRFDIEPDLPPLPCDIGVRRNLFLAVKEALNNVLRHAGATRVEIRIRRERQELVVIIRDNGRGFDAQAMGEGNGLGNMAMRAREAGGEFAWSSRPGEGARLEFRVPIPTRRRLRFVRLFRGERLRDYPHSGGGRSGVR